MARKPSTRKRREPAPAASTRAEPAASNKRPMTSRAPPASARPREGRDAFQPRGAARRVVRVRGAAGRARRDVEDVRRGGPHAREIGAHDSDGGPALDVSGEVPRVAAEALNGGRGPTPRRPRGHRRGPRERRARSDRGRALPAAGRAPRRLYCREGHRGCAGRLRRARPRHVEAGPGGAGAPSGAAPRPRDHGPARVREPKPPASRARRARVGARRDGPADGRGVPAGRPASSSSPWAPRPPTLTMAA